MAIKPKSRKHEDRIKALENCELAQRDENQTFACDIAMVFHRLNNIERYLDRPWYKRIFGL